MSQHWQGQHVLEVGLFYTSTQKLCVCQEQLNWWLKMRWDIVLNLLDFLSFLCYMNAAQGSNIRPLPLECKRAVPRPSEGTPFKNTQIWVWEGAQWAAGMTETLHGLSQQEACSSSNRKHLGDIFELCLSFGPVTTQYVILHTDLVLNILSVNYNLLWEILWWRRNQ